MIIENEMLHGSLPRRMGRHGNQQRHRGRTFPRPPGFPGPAVHALPEQQPDLGEWDMSIRYYQEPEAGGSVLLPQNHPSNAEHLRARRRKFLSVPASCARDEGFRATAYSSGIPNLLPRQAGRIMTPPPERRIHPTAPVPLARLPDESGVPVGSVIHLGGGAEIRPGRRGPRQIN